MFTRNPDAERKIPTTVKLTHSQRRRAEQKARELGMSTHAFMLKVLDEACRGERRQPG
jgi:hypothetical protein